MTKKPPPPTPTLIGELIRQWRLHRTLTPTAFARRVGVTRVAVVQWESGVTAPRQSRMAKIVAALGCTLPGFYEGPPPAGSDEPARAA